MKKTIWRPLVLGVVLGLLAGLATVTGLFFIVPGTEDVTGYYNAIGFYMILLLLAAALGGPQAGAIASILWLTIENFFGPPDMKAIFDDPEVFWANLIVVGTLMVLVGFAHRLIFEQVKMPARLLLWSVLVIVVYIIIVPANIALQAYLLDAVVVLPAILFGYRTYIPQAIFDIFFTSLVFIALPASYTRPLWYEPKKALDRSAEIPDR